MKKVLLTITIILSVFLITGCGIKSGNGGKSGGNSGGSILNPTKTMTCTKEETDENGKKTSEKMIITYNSTKVLKVNNTQIIDTDPNYMELTLKVGKGVAEEMSKVDGITLSYEAEGTDKVKVTTEVEFEKVNLDQLKEVLGGLYDENNTESIYGDKDYTIEKFKKENLEGYTCK